MCIGSSQNYLECISITGPELTPDRSILIEEALEGVSVFLPENMVTLNSSGNIELSLPEKISAFYSAVDLVAILASDIDAAFRSKNLALRISHPCASDIISLGPCRRDSERRQADSNHPKQQE